MGDLSAIAQTAVGEASNAFYANEVEAVIGTIVNRQNLNIAAYPQRGSFARGQAVIATPGNLRGGVLGEYDAHRFRLRHNQTQWRTSKWSSPGEQLCL